MAHKLMLRYTGPACARRFLIERADHLFWGDSGWVKHSSKAVLYRSMRDAHAGCAALQRAEIEGVPRREFRCTFTVSLIGEDAAGVRPRDLVEYLTGAVLVSLDYEAADDGLVAGSHVECGVKVAGLKEVAGRKRKRQDSRVTGLSRRTRPSSPGTG